MYATALSCSRRRNSAHSWAARVLLGLRTRTGRCSSSTTQDMTFVLPLPVTPARTCWVRPAWTPSTSWAIACGWSPAGRKGASTRKRTRYQVMKDEIKGKADELKGKLTGDKAEEVKGKMEQKGDKLRRNARDIRDDVKDKADEMNDEARERERERDAEAVREKRSW